MKPFQKILFIFYWIVLLTDCSFAYYNLNEYRYFTKLLLMPVLYASVLYSTIGTRHPRSKLIISFALLFGWIGDVVLLSGTADSTFTTGLFSFLVAHILYIVFFLHIVPFKQKGIVVNILAAIFLTAFLVLFLFVLWELISDLQTPVTIYAIAVSFMVLSAVNTTNSGKVRRLGRQNFVPGALLFLLSDTLLAANKFAFEIINKKFEGIILLLPVAIMLTYGSAQFLIVYGAVRYLRNKSGSRLSGKASDLSER